MRIKRDSWLGWGCQNRWYHLCRSSFWCFSSENLFAELALAPGKGSSELEFRRAFHFIAAVNLRVLIRAGILLEQNG